ncbi:MAG: DUF116 domain-containing protein [Humidesulfovibrio sp.]
MLHTAVPGTSRKRLFIGLIAGTCVLVCALLALLWVVPYVGLRNIHPQAPLVLGILLGVLLVLVLWASLGLVLSVVLPRPLPLARRVRGITVKLLLPMMSLLGRMLGFSKEDIHTSFIKVNNEMVLRELGRFEPSRILLLMPHCLQNSHCEMRLTHDVDNCKRCGKCPITGLLELRDKYGVHLAVATGGTIARRIVVDKRPKVIIAVACYRDLSSGIQDTYPLPVFGVLNERPFGPCLDTRVHLGNLEAALKRFLR